MSTKETHLYRKTQIGSKYKDKKGYTWLYTNQNKVGISIINSKVDFKAKSIMRDKEGDFITIKMPVHHQHITILDVDA